MLWFVIVCLSNIQILILYRVSRGSMLSSTSVRANAQAPPKVKFNAIMAEMERWLDEPQLGTDKLVNLDPLFPEPVMETPPPKKIRRAWTLRKEPLGTVGRIDFNLALI